MQKILSAKYEKSQRKQNGKRRRNVTKLFSSIKFPENSVPENRFNHFSLQNEIIFWRPVKCNLWCFSSIFVQIEIKTMDCSGENKEGRPKASTVSAEAKT